jgi:hypothetical protein
VKFCPLLELHEIDAEFRIMAMENAVNTNVIFLKHDTFGA